MRLMKPPKCCHPDCFNCPYVDCRWDGYDGQEVLTMDDAIDRELNRENNTYEQLRRYLNNKKYLESDKGKRTAEKYRKSEKYKDVQNRYERSKKGAERKKRYEQSEKGKARQKKYSQSERGREKNREACKKYYHKKKLEKQQAMAR